MTAEEKRYIQARLAGNLPSMAASIAVSQLLAPRDGTRFMEWIRAASALHERMQQWEHAEENLPCTLL